MTQASNAVVPASAAAFTRSLPKAELHVHLEGCLEAEMLFALAERNDVALPWASPQALRAAYDFSGLEAFLRLYFEGCRVLVHEQDFYDVTRSYLARAHADNVVRAEAFLGPQSFTERGVPIAAVLGGVLRAMADAEAEDGISAGLLVSAHRHRSEADAFELLESVLPWADQIAGFGLGGAEVGNPPSKFARYFAELRRLGCRTSAHAGEEGPAAYVREAVEVLEVDRVDHGLSVLDDPDLVAAIAGRGTPLTVCPLSNVRLRVVPDLDSHPLPAMLDAGLNVTVNSDDPAYFGGYVGENLLQCQGAFGWSPETVAGLAGNSIRASFLPAVDQEVHLQRIADGLARHLATTAPPGQDTPVGRYDLERFVVAQDAGGTYDRAVDELRRGHKTSHWMWFVFPQIRGLGQSPMSREFAISSLEEARAYLRHPVLGPRLVECAGIVAAAEGRGAEEIFGSVDARKLRSSMTLFMRAAPGRLVFERVLDRCFAGAPDPATDQRL